MMLYNNLRKQKTKYDFLFIEDHNHQAETILFYKKEWVKKMLMIIRDESKRIRPFHLCLQRENNR